MEPRVLVPWVDMGGWEMEGLDVVIDEGVHLANEGGADIEWVVRGGEHADGGNGRRKDSEERRGSGTGQDGGHGRSPDCGSRSRGTRGVDASRHGSRAGKDGARDAGRLRGRG